MTEIFKQNCLEVIGRLYKVTKQRDRGLEHMDNVQTAYYARLWSLSLSQKTLTKVHSV